MSATATHSQDARPNLSGNIDVVIVGAGFAGMYMLHKMRGLGMTARVIEAGSDVGGTWYWNRYPGARCDTESMQYSFGFSNELQQAWSWSQHYAPQPEILRYAQHVADRFDLRRDIAFNTRVTAAHFDDAARRWTVRTDRGDTLSARYCVMATGCLSNAREPDFPGKASFKGKTYHTGQWPHEEVSFAGKHVAVIGTGSSGIQAIPVIAAQAAHLTVFQRTPNYSIPCRNRPMTAEYEQSWKTVYSERRAQQKESRVGIVYKVADVSALAVSAEERQKEYETRWAAGGTSFIAAYNDLIIDKAANDTAAEFVREQIRKTVKNPAVAEKLAPKDYPIATKRLCADTDYFETYNRDNVTLVDVREAPIETLTPNGLRAGGVEYEVDAIVFATGFDAVTGTLNAIDIRGRGGKALKEKWEAGPRTYLGIMSAGFPNLFLITGPGSPSVLSNMIVSIEQHVEWISDCLAHLRDGQLGSIEADQDAEDAWVEHVNAVAHKTLYPQANSWYMGANIPGKPRVFLPYIGGVGAYRRKCAEIVAAGYKGFTTAPLAANAAE
jgi:cyclohexanone monooxygenase